MLGLPVGLSASTRPGLRTIARVDDEPHLAEDWAQAVVISAVPPESARSTGGDVGLGAPSI
jgi:hypothetical protein